LASGKFSASQGLPAADSISDARSSRSCALQSADQAGDRVRSRFGPSSPSAQASPNRADATRVPDAGVRSPSGKSFLELIPFCCQSARAHHGPVVGVSDFRR